MEVEDGNPCSNKHAGVTGVLEIMEVPENGHIGAGDSPPEKVEGSTAQLKCIYTNAHSVSNKQEKLGAIVQWEKYGLIAIRKHYGTT